MLVYFEIWNMCMREVWTCICRGLRKFTRVVEWGWTCTSTLLCSPSGHFQPWNRFLRKGMRFGFVSPLRGIITHKGKHSWAYNIFNADGTLKTLLILTRPPAFFIDLRQVQYYVFFHIGNIQQYDCLRSIM